MVPTTATLGTLNAGMILIMIIVLGTAGFGAGYMFFLTNTSANWIVQDG